MVVDYDTKIQKLEKKTKDLNDRILAIENKYLYIARSETKELYKDKSELNNKILKLRKAKQNACNHEDYPVESVDLGGNVYVEDFCSNCNKSLGRDTTYNKKMKKAVAELAKSNNV